MTQTSITILHLSDLQFGKNHRFGRLTPEDDKFDTLIQRLCDDLDLMKNDEKLSPDIVAITGDLTQVGKKSEFEDARKFIEELLNHLKLHKTRLAMVPGNHDINWNLCESYFKWCDAEEIKPARPYWKKYQFFKEKLFDPIYRDMAATFTEDEYWTLFEIPELKTVIAGLNSTFDESHNKDHHFGSIGEAQYRYFHEKMKDYQNKQWLRIAILHHNIRRGCVADDEHLHDSDDLERWFGDHFNLFLHGHTHNENSIG